ncbi:N-acyl-D-amino-acid deacylase family protein [Candidatus Entotheonella palauensis]|uniref:N-acyl-D-amino-acid deacylase family protein n=1 Tax=Candidatus Entotheonella palauensis TaxID=93172 RepID=UPI000B7E3C0E|nr:amidohydrolase family protein [Candidatus Entotheonella palauensis]
MYDLIFRNARIADGLGNPLVDGDLAVVDGKVAAIGTISDPAIEELDAQGLVLAPGAVDLHTHYDAQLTWDQTASPAGAVGVTTVVIGNCGFGIAPAPPDKRATILANLAEVEGMALSSLEAGVEWGFETFGEYLGFLRQKGVYPNVAVLASHTVMRTAVMGDAGSERLATPCELDAMLVLFREAMDAGAIGLGSSTNENHRGAGGIPIASRLANDDEFRAFAKVLSNYDHGVFMMTCGEHHGIPFMEEMSQLSGKASFYAPLFHYAHQPQRAAGIMRAAEVARTRGVPVYAQGSCQPLSLSFTLDHAYILKAMSPWPATEDRDELRCILSDPSFRAAFRETLAKPDRQHIFKGRWDWVPVATTVLPKNAGLAGRTIADIAAERRADPLDVFLDLGLEEDFGTKYTLFMLNMDEDGVAELLVNDGTLISLSDAGAHNAMLCDAGYAMYLLGHWVRNRGLFDLPTAIRKVTSDPADAYGIMDRGRLTPGAWADMILFDPEVIRITNMEQHFDLPAGGERLLRRAPGLHGTWVNGVRVFDGENYLSVQAPGHVLTEFSASRPQLGMPVSR